MRSLSLTVSLAARNIGRQRRRSAIAVSAVAFGITALILASGFIEWIFLDFREQTIKSQLGHLQISRPGYHEAGKADPYSFLLPEKTISLSASGGSDRISTIAPRLSFSGLISKGESTLSFIGEGVSPHNEEAFAGGLQISAGTNLGSDGPLSVIVGEGLARNLDISVGDRVVLLVNTASGGTNGVEVTVCGLFSTVTKSYDDSALRLPLETARRLLRAQGAHIWVVLLKDTADTDVILRELQGRLSQNDFEVVPWYQLADFYNKTAELFTRQVEGVRIIIALIILLGISNTMTTSVMERIGEIGTSMALGTRRTSIMGLFLCEGTLLGCVGGILGIMAGLVLAGLISHIGIPMPPPPGMAHGYIGQILVTKSIVLHSMVMAVSTTLVASILPAWRASRMEIVNALRHNR